MARFDEVFAAPPNVVDVELYVLYLLLYLLRATGVGMVASEAVEAK